MIKKFKTDKSFETWKEQMKPTYHTYTDIELNNIILENDEKEINETYYLEED